jgi:hypothetical protein
MIEARLLAFDELERIRLVPAAQKRPPSVAPALRESELDAPAGDGLVEVGDPEADVVNAAES